MTIRVDTTLASGASAKGVLSEDFILKRATNEQILALNEDRDKFNSSIRQALDRALARIADEAKTT